MVMGSATNFLFVDAAVTNVFFIHAMLENFYDTNAVISKGELHSIIFYNGSTALVSLGLLYEVPRSHSGTPRSVGLLPDEGSAPRRDLYLTTYNTHKKQASMHPAGFDPAISASERPQTHALDRAATGIGLKGIRID